MNKSSEIGEIAGALAKFQGEVGAVQKDRTAKVKMKNGGEYTYAYADLATVIETARAPLAKHGLSVTQMTLKTETGFILETTVMHTSGQWLAGSYPLPLDGDAQTIGSEITYARRYSLCAALNIAAEEDDDANRKVTAPVIGSVTHSAPVVASGGKPSPDACDKCGKKMMVSKMKENSFYCTTCKVSKPMMA